MCFAPQADVVGGLVVGAIGVDAFRHLRGRNSHLLLAGLPLLLGAHQLDEAFVWWGLEGQVPHEVGRVALWIYLLIAFVVVPTFVPIAVLALETTPHRRRSMMPFVVLGVQSRRCSGGDAARPIGVTEHPITSRTASTSVTAASSSLYVVATCGVVVLRIPPYRNLGVANLIAVALLAWLTIDGFASLWCAYAALAAGAIALHMRYAKPHRATPYVLS